MTPEPPGPPSQPPPRKPPRPGGQGNPAGPGRPGPPRSAPGQSGPGQSGRPISPQGAPGREPRRRPQPPIDPEADNEYNDIVWDDEDDDAIFTDETLQGEVSLTDYVTKKRAMVVVGVFVSIILLFSIVTWFRAQFAAPGPQGGEVTLRVPSGATISSFASTLEKNDVIGSSFGLKVWLKFNDSPDLQAGEYVFHKNSSPGEVVADIKKGPKQSSDRLTIPEGFRLRQIAQRVGRLPGFSEQKFLDLAASGTVRSEFQPSTSKNLEGFLFPDTYLLSPRDTEQTLLQRMVNQFDQVARQLGLDRSARAIGYSPYETLVIASMIEAEAKVDADRGKISQVIQNRLNAPMPLQIDATLLYGMGNTKNSVSTNDTKTPGPYNTYLNAGIPPTPIGNPGRKSIQAALAPTPGPWLYYVVKDEQGNHAFSTTLEEHNRNVRFAQEKKLY